MRTLFLDWGPAGGDFLQRMPERFDIASLKRSKQYSTGGVDDVRRVRFRVHRPMEAAVKIVREHGLRYVEFRLQFGCADGHRTSFVTLVHSAPMSSNSLQHHREQS